VDSIRPTIANYILMKSKTQVNFNFDSFNLIGLIFKYWKVLFATGMIALIISVFISVKITPMFRSTVVLYPTTNVVESQTLFGIQGSTKALFGDETATEKVLQILKSDDIKNFLVSKYDLIKHYKIAEKARYKYTILDAVMRKNISSNKTQYNSVEINVLDADPVIAAIMANDIARQIDTVFNRIVKKAGQKSYIALKTSFEEQINRVRSLEDSLRLISPKGFFSPLRESNKAGMKNSSWISTSGQYSPDYLRLMSIFESENDNLSTIQGRLIEAKALVDQDLPYIHLINEAKVSEKKATPKRSLIVLASTFSTLLFMMFILALKDASARDEE
jgi:uncharacterized protein involved in exopolysaccharide biosynthesis